MHLLWYLSLFALLFRTGVLATAFDLLHNYSGLTFFSGWEFYGKWDNLTLGNVTYQTALLATEYQLVSVNEAGNAIIRVDNRTTVSVGERRNSVRLTSSEFYDFGSLWIIDLLHIPYGCSVWPAFWSTAPNWPDGGEIDIIEAINLATSNQMALHTTAGCTHYPQVNQTGYNIDTDCGTGSGCTVGIPANNSYGPGFASVGGGVYATWFDESGIFMWFWSRPDVPDSIANAGANSSMDVSTFGIPTASFPTNTSCNITQFYKPQQLIFDITLCGDWAGVPGIYDSQCYNAGPNHDCYLDCVVGDGSNYDDAYFEVRYVRTYSDRPVTPSTTGDPTTQTSQASTQPHNAARSTRAEWRWWLGLPLAAICADMLLRLL